MLEMLELWVTYSRGEEPVLEKRCVFCRQQSQRHRAKGLPHSVERAGAVLIALFTEAQV